MVQGGVMMERKKTKKSNFRYLGRVTKDLYKIMPIEITAVLILDLLYSAILFVQVYVTADVFDAAGNYLGGTGTAEELQYRAGIFTLFFALPLLLDLIGNPIRNIPIFNKHHALIHKLHARVVSMPLIRFEDPEFHNEIWRAKLVVYNTGLLNYFFGFTDFIPNIVRFAGTVCVIASFDVRFIPLAILSVVPTFISKWIYNRELYKMRRSQTPLARRRDYLWNVLTGKDTVKELRTMQTENYIKDKWIKARDEVLEQDFAFDMKSTNVFLFCDLFRLFGFAASIIMSVYFASRGIISVGQFAACISAFGGLQAMTETLVGMVADQNSKADFLGDFYDFFDNATETEGDEPFDNFISDISIKNISFAYPVGNKEVLHDVSFTIKKGERVVIVGENGSGKTTLSKIIAGVYEPSSGEVTYDGKNVSAFERDSFYRKFSVISQDFVKYQLTMRENIGMSTPNQIHNDEKLLESAKAANIEQIVRRIGGLDTQLGREFDGVELSGGEWQKVSIARGLNKDADIIILDEPTSALDPLVEYDILKKFVDLTEGKTSVIISHRVGLCRFADRIIVMRDGCIVGNGTHEELLWNNAEYERIWREQAKWYS